MKITMRETGRGFTRGEFIDHYGEVCSIQESSIMMEGNGLWLGCNKMRMHLDRETAQELTRLLCRFAKTGRLKE